MQYTLSQLCALIGEVIDAEFPETYWVTAEIASVSTRSGHGYLDLIESQESPAKGNLVAKIRANCWANRWMPINAYFTEQTGETLRAGLQILIEVTVTFHAQYGISLNIININPQYTLGGLAKERQETIRKLQESGMMDANKSCVIPTIIRRVAVVSSDSAAGYGDFCNQLTNNEFGFKFVTKLYPAFMQGERAPQSIVNALRNVNEDGCDVVVIIRGGGAAIDLSCFDDYNLALNCSQFPYPLISGIGHQRDVSVVDMVAHTSVKTPTAAAEFIIAHNAEQVCRLQDLSQQLYLACNKRLLLERRRMDNLRMQIMVTISSKLAQAKTKLEFMGKTIELHSPEKIFQKGYSLTMANGKIVRSAADVNAGETITTHLADGTITSTVK